LLDVLRFAGGRTHRWVVKLIGAAVLARGSKLDGVQTIDGTSFDILHKECSLRYSSVSTIVGAMKLGVITSMFSGCECSR
jgi:hypothetical protein